MKITYAIVSFVFGLYYLLSLSFTVIDTYQTTDTSFYSTSTFIAITVFGLIFVYYLLQNVYFPFRRKPFGVFSRIFMILGDAVLFLAMIIVSWSAYPYMNAGNLVLHFASLLCLAFLFYNRLKGTPPLLNKSNANS